MRRQSLHILENSTRKDQASRCRHQNGFLYEEIHLWSENLEASKHPAPRPATRTFDSITTHHWGTQESPNGKASGKRTYMQVQYLLNERGRKQRSVIGKSCSRQCWSHVGLEVELRSKSPFLLFIPVLSRAGPGRQARAVVRAATIGAAAGEKVPGKRE